MFELSGTIKVIFETQTFESGFTKREFVITTEDKYPQDIQFEFIKDKIALLEGVSEGNQVTVSFDVRGREWKGRYFVNLNAWKIQTQKSASHTETPTEVNEPMDKEADNIPF